MSLLNKPARYICPRSLGSGAGIFLAALLLAGCTTLETYSNGRLGPDLPIAAGDKIVLYFTDPQTSSRTLRVRSLNADTFRGELPWDRDTVETHRWESIKYIEHRRYSAGKTAIVTLLGILTIIAARDIGEVFAEPFENFPSKAD